MLAKTVLYRHAEANKRILLFIGMKLVATTDLETWRKALHTTELDVQLACKLIHKQRSDL